MVERRVAFRYFDLGFSLVVPMVALMVLWAGENFLFGRWGACLRARRCFTVCTVLSLG